MASTNYWWVRLGLKIPLPQPLPKSSGYWVMAKELWKSSPVSPQSKKGEDFRIVVSGVQKLELLSRSLGSHFGAHNIWIDIRLVKLPKEKQPTLAPATQAEDKNKGSVVHLADLKPKSVIAHKFVREETKSVGGIERTRCMTTIPLRPDTPARVAYDIGGQYDLVVGTVGIWDRARRGIRSSQTFYVFGDEKELWKSSPIPPHSANTEHFRIDVTGVHSLVLCARSNGDHYSAEDIWIDPQLLILSKEKQPTPDEDAVAEATKTIHEVYKKEYAAKDKGPLIELLLARGREAVKDPVSQFVFLSEAQDVAMAAGDYKSAFEAIDDLGRAFKVDAIATKMEVLRAAVPDPKYQEAIVTEAKVLAVEAANQGDEETVEQLGRMAYSAARRLRNTEQLKQVVAFNKSTKEWVNFVVRCKRAVDDLKDNPDDPSINSWAGKCYCLVEGDWDKGLPLLVKGSPDSLRKVAVQDATNPTTVDDQVVLADAWWELYEKVGRRSW